MSTLNKAFIKAYQRRGVGAPHILLTARPSEPPPAAPETPLPETPLPETPLPETPLPETPTSDSAGSVVEDEPPAAESTPPTESSSTTDAVPQAAPMPPVADSASDVAHDLAPSGDLIPAFEVERFDWPQTVSSLIKDKNASQLGALMGELLPEGRGTLIVSGCRRGEGRTSVALVIARHLARRGARVVILDADVEQPQLASRLGMLVEAGWETGLADELPAGEALIESLRDRLTLVPLKRPLSDSETGGLGACLKQLMERLQAEFEIVCVDAGPLADAGQLSHETLFGRAHIDAGVVVRDVRHCRQEQTQAVGRKLAQLGVRRWAVVENFCSVGAS